jgi:PAS domain S-box-containing protein
METRFEEMRRYVRLGEEEARLIASFGRVATPWFPEIVQQFYDRIREHEDAHAVLVDEAQIARLQASMIRWLTRLCSGNYDEAYFVETGKVGRVHVKVGLPQRYMFTAMALIRVALNEIVDREMEGDAPRVRSALARLLDLELGVMLESYREHFVERLQHVERMEKEELGRSLARATHWYQSAVELARVMIIGLDGEGNVRLWNREAERVTGHQRDEATGRSFVELLAPVDSRDALLRNLAEARVREASEGPRFADVLLTRAGHVRSVRWQLAFSPTTGDEVEMFAIGQDVTEEAAQVERTHQQEKLAAVGTLAAGLAHEIRNPLNGAQLHLAYLARSLKRDAARPDLQEAVSVVDDEIKRLANLATEFLDFARPRPLVRRPLSVRALAERCTQLVAAEAAAASLSLVQDIPTADVTVHGDPDKLEQVLLNLLRNAIEAAANGAGSVVTVRARRQPRNAVVEVEDDGPGLVRPDAPIFDAFFSTKPSGTGLGLAITHRIVTDHGGSVDVESRPGRTVFRLRLPLDAAARQPTLSPHEREG